MKALNLALAILSLLARVQPSAVDDASAVANQDRLHHNHQQLHARLDINNDHCIDVSEMAPVQDQLRGRSSARPPLPPQHPDPSPQPAGPTVSSAFFSAAAVCLLLLSSLIVCNSWETFAIPIIIMLSGHLLLCCGVAGEPLAFNRMD